MIVHVQMDSPRKILQKRGMEKNGKAQLFLATELRRRSDKYVPMRSGVLKNTAQVQPGKIIYNTPYARRQWYEHRGKGLRGKMWCIRCWASESGEIASALSAYVGGKKR